MSFHESTGVCKQSHNQKLATCPESGYVTMFNKEAYVPTTATTPTTTATETTTTTADLPTTSFLSMVSFAEESSTSSDLNQLVGEGD